MLILVQQTDTFLISKACNTFVDKSYYVNEVQGIVSNSSCDIGLMLPVYQIFKKLAFLCDKARNILEFPKYM
jgi:hypothetical protein